MSQIAGFRPPGGSNATGTFGIVRFFGSYYGPYAFGLLSLVLIWFTIVAPELRASRADRSKIEAVASAQATMTESLGRTADELGRVAALQDRTAAVMDRALDRLERVSSTLESTSDKMRGLGK